MKKKIAKSYKNASMMVRMEPELYDSIVACAHGMGYGLSGYVREVLRVHGEMLRASGPAQELVPGAGVTTYAVAHQAWKTTAVQIGKSALIQIPAIIDRQREPREGIEMRVMKKRSRPGKRQEPPSPKKRRTRS